MPEQDFNYYLYIWIGLAVIIFLINLKIVAPYGRHTNKKWGVLVNTRFAWVLMEAPVLFLVTYLFLTGTASRGITSWVIYMVFAFHYINRTFIYPFRIKNGKKNMPLVIMLMAVLFNCANGFFIGYYLGNYAAYGAEWLTSIYFISGLGLFVLGMLINWKSDNILIGLRKQGGERYKIPYGFLFTKVSCPNHLGEVVEWFGYALMSFNLPALSFAIWTAANLIPRSLAHHRWYLEKFDRYPKERKAVIPGIL